MNVRRLVGMWVGLLGELLLVAAECIDPSPQHYTVIDDLSELLREYVWERS